MKGVWEVVVEGKEDCSVNSPKNIFLLWFTWLMLENGYLRINLP